MLNLFKSQLLGERHMPKRAQTEDVLTALSVIGMDETFDPRTWHRWFEGDVRRARGDSISTLDKASMKLRPINLPVGLHNVSPYPLFFSEMMEGGLCKALLAPTSSKKPKYPVLQTADEYWPVSSWHLHLDAVEALALADANGDVEWETVKAIAATRVMAILHSRWSPRDGSIYSTLSSNLHVEWAQASMAEREQIQSFYSRMAPNLFNHCMAKSATPDWTCTNVEIDIASTQVHRLLFSLAADAEFLVADRFEAWALDLATAALAMLASAFANRHNTFGKGVGPELVYWEAFEMLFFGEEESESLLFDSLHRAMEFSGVTLSMRSIELLVKAGAEYKLSLSTLGISQELILGLTSRCWRVHPMVYGKT